MREVIEKSVGDPTEDSPVIISTDCQNISKAGIYNMDEGHYHADPCLKPSLSSGVARTLGERSPRHAMLKHPRLNPDFVPENKRMYDLGRAAHAMLLEDSEAKIALLEHKDYRTKIAKEERDLAYNNDMTPLLEKEYYPLKQMIDVAKQKIELTEFKGILQSGKSEQSLIWQMENGVWCRGRADLISDQNNWNVIMDYKTTTIAHPEVWIKGHIMDYVFQAYFYLEGYRIITGNEASFFFFVQENTPPYDCSVIGLSEELLAIGKIMVENAVEIWRYCIKHNRWDGYSMATHYAPAPYWALTKYQDEIIQRLEA